MFCIFYDINAVNLAAKKPTNQEEGFYCLATAPSAGQRLHGNSQRGYHSYGVPGTTLLCEVWELNFGFFLDIY